MKDFLRELWPLVRLLLIGFAFSLFLGFLFRPGSSNVGGATYWDEEDQMNQALDLMYRDSIPQ